MSLIRMEISPEVLADNIVIEPIIKDGKVLFGLGPHEALWLAADGSAVRDERLEDGNHHTRIYRAGKVVSEEWGPLPN
jgi:hypothetical protein